VKGDERFLGHDRTPGWETKHQEFTPAPLRGPIMGNGLVSRGRKTCVFCQAIAQEDFAETAAFPAAHDLRAKTPAKRREAAQIFSVRPERKELQRLQVAGGI
jgi:hypothetical protein